MDFKCLWCFAEQETSEENNDVTDPSVLSPSSPESTNKETANQIRSLLNEIGSNNLVTANLETPNINFHPCPWCSGRLITVWLVPSSPLVNSVKYFCRTVCTLLKSYHSLLKMNYVQFHSDVLLAKQKKWNLFWYLFNLDNWLLKFTFLQELNFLVCTLVTSIDYSLLLTLFCIVLLYLSVFI